MFSFARFEGSSLPRSAGRDDGRCRVSDGGPGHICHGPYITLSSGVYTAGFYVRRTGPFDLGFVEIDVCTDHGKTPFGNRAFQVNRLLVNVAGFIKLDFELRDDCRDVEVRLFVPSGVLVSVRELVIFNRVSREWAAA